MIIETIKATEAPSAVAKVRENVGTMVLAHMKTVGSDEAIAITDDKLSVRGIKTSIGRAANAAGVKLNVWHEGNKVFVQNV